MAFLGSENQRLAIRRRIEILGLVLNSSERVTKLSVSEKYGIESAQVNRDLSEIRKSGIMIYSKGKGVLQLTNEISEDTIVTAIENYFLLCSVNDVSRRAIVFFVRKFGQKALWILITIINCTETRTNISVNYAGNAKHGDTSFIFAPLLLFEAGYDIRLMGYIQDSQRQILLQKILDLKPTGQSIPPYISLPAGTFNSLFRCWVGGDSISIELKYSRSWLAFGKTPQLSENQIIERNSDGTLTVKLQVCDLDDVARWLAGKGDEVVAIAPEQLREKVIIYAEKTIKVYNNLPD